MGLDPFVTMPFENLIVMSCSLTGFFFDLLPFTWANYSHNLKHEFALNRKCDTHILNLMPAMSALAVNVDRW